MRILMLIDWAAMMLLHRFDILNDIHKLCVVIVLVLRNRRIINRLRWTIGTKFSFVHAAYISHIIVIITVHNNYPLPDLEYTLLYSPTGETTCTLDPQGKGLQGLSGLRTEGFAVYLC